MIKEREQGNGGTVMDRDAANKVMEVIEAVRAGRELEQNDPVVLLNAVKTAVRGAELIAIMNVDTVVNGLDRGFKQAVIRLSERAIIVLGIYEAIRDTGEAHAAAAFLDKAIHLDSYKS